MAVGNDAFLMLHEEAFVAVEPLLATLRNRLGEKFRWVMASAKELPVAEAVFGYPFNSQVLTLPDGSMCIVAPIESRQRPKPRAFLERVVAEDNPVTQVHYLDVRQSMNNGGGPACLRQRIRLTDEERAAVKARVFLDEDARGGPRGVDPEALPRAAGDAGPRGPGAGEGVDDRARRADEDPPDRQRLRFPADARERLNRRPDER